MTDQIELMAGEHHVMMSGREALDQRITDSVNSNTQLYSEDDILEKDLYLLIPYCILKYEHIREGDSLKKISTEYHKLYQGMIEARNAGKLNEYDLSNIMDFTNRLAEYLFDKNSEAKQEVNAVMGGEVLETYADQMIYRKDCRKTLYF